MSNNRLQEMYLTPDWYPNYTARSIYDDAILSCNAVNPRGLRHSIGEWVEQGIPAEHPALLLMAANADQLEGKIADLDIWREHFAICNSLSLVWHMPNGAYYAEKRPDAVLRSHLAILDYALTVWSNMPFNGAPRSRAMQWGRIIQDRWIEEGFGPAVFIPMQVGDTYDFYCYQGVFNHPHLWVFKRGMKPEWVTGTYFERRTHDST
jgi:hypothetical protein